ncbi:MAG: DUF790 family protein [Myxococcota bacterium]
MPADALPLRIRGATAAPDWFGPPDHGWLRALLDELLRFEGRPARELASGRDALLRCPAPKAKARFAWELLERSCGKVAPPLASPDLRLAVFRGAASARASGKWDRDRVLANVAEPLGMAAEEPARLLLADLAGERRVTMPAPPPDTASLVASANLALAQGVLRAASHVDLQVRGNARPVLRQVRLTRLLYTATGDASAVRLLISGPVALFHHTTLYGRALSSLARVLGRAERFELTARIHAAGRTLDVAMRSGDPLPAPAEDPRWDSRLEERFARDFLHAAPDWDLVREPAPLVAGTHVVFPDFEVVHRRDPGRRCLLEIVGFWTPEYLSTKLDRLRRAGAEHLVLCIDEDRACEAGSLPPGAVLVPFRRRIDVERVKSIVEQMPVHWVGGHSTKAPAC